MWKTSKKSTEYSSEQEGSTIAVDLYEIICILSLISLKLCTGIF